MHDQSATCEGIRNGLGWLLSDNAGGGRDIRVFHFSSHGTQVDDQDGDDWEGMDEVIVPYDHDWDMPFRDDELGGSSIKFLTTSTSPSSPIVATAAVFRGLSGTATEMRSVKLLRPMAEMHVEAAAAKVI